MMTGHCLCGAVEVRVAEGHETSASVCHCSYCRRWTGSAFWGFAADGKLVSSSGPVASYRSTPFSERGFCATCGTTMFFRSALAPGETHVALACADGPIDRAPALHVFTEAQVPWIELGDALPRADRDHPALVRYQAVDRAPT